MNFIEYKHISLTRLGKICGHKGEFLTKGQICFLKVVSNFFVMYGGIRCGLEALFINTSVQVVFLNNHRDCRPALSDLLHIVYTKKTCP